MPYGHSCGLDTGCAHIPLDWVDVVEPVRLFLSLSSETVFGRRPPPIAVSAVALRRDRETVQTVGADHRAAFSV